MIFKCYFENNQYSFQEQMFPCIRSGQETQYQDYLHKLERFQLSAGPRPASPNSRIFPARNINYPVVKILYKNKFQTSIRICNWFQNCFIFLIEPDSFGHFHHHLHTLNKDRIRIAAPFCFWQLYYGGGEHFIDPPCINTYRGVYIFGNVLL